MELLKRLRFERIFVLDRLDSAHGDLLYNLDAETLQCGHVRGRVGEAG